jgi:hypothetical protein
MIKNIIKKLFRRTQHIEAADTALTREDKISLILQTKKPTWLTDGMDGIT